MPDRVSVPPAGKGMHGNGNTQIDQHIVQRPRRMKGKDGQCRRQRYQRPDHRIHDKWPHTDEDALRLVLHRLVQNIAGRITQLKIDYFEYGYFEIITEQLVRQLMYDDTGKG